MIVIHGKKATIVGRACAAALSVSMTACAFHADISHSQTRRIDNLNDDFRVAGNTLPSRTAPRLPAFLIEVRSRIDIAKIIQRQQMAFLYFNLVPCTDVKDTLYSAEGYVRSETSPNPTDGYYYYYAAIPLDYWKDVDQYRDLMSMGKASRSEKLCINFGAGSMASQVLKTNSVPAELN